MYEWLLKEHKVCGSGLIATKATEETVNRETTELWFLLNRSNNNYKILRATSNPVFTPLTCLLSVQAVSGEDITVRSYKVESRITSRFAHVTVRSSVVNSGSKAQSIAFNVQIPKRAFISNFTMWAKHSCSSPSHGAGTIWASPSVAGTWTASYSWARWRRRPLPGTCTLRPDQKTRQQASSGAPERWWTHPRSCTTTHNQCVFLPSRANSQDLETFKTEVHVPPGSNIEFELHYQEMMERKLGFYEHLLYLQPGRLVPHFQVRRYWFMLYLCVVELFFNPICCQVDVYIYEPNGISFMETPNTLGAQFAELVQVTSTKDKVRNVYICAFSSYLNGIHELLVKFHLENLKVFAYFHHFSWAFISNLGLVSCISQTKSTNSYFRNNIFRNKTCQYFLWLRTIYRIFWTIRHVRIIRSIKR